MPARIEIGVIPQDLRHEETIIQIAEALDNLGSAMSHIFDCINTRISDNDKRLDMIQSRAEKVQGQMEYLQTNLSLKAVKMYSAAKYPASHTYKEYTSVLKAIPKKEPLTSIYKSPVPIADTLDMHLTAGSKTENGQYAANINIQEKLQFYYVKSKPYKRITEETTQDRIIPGASSVSALMLFNSSKSKNQSSHSANQTNDKCLEDAPDSILQPWYSSEVESPSSYLYAPTLGEVPQINVPLILPDLPGIVDDERFVLDLNSQNPIAPSSAAVTPTVRLDLPTPVSVTEEKNFPSVSEQTLQNLPNFTDTKTVTPEVVVPPPPPPPSIQNVEKQPPIPPPFQVQGPPPPPPPPPPSAPTEESKLPEKKQTSSVPPRALPADDRTNLMEAIRNAGGVGRAKLRPIIPAAKTNDRFASASVGGDLMDDLHAKLAMRRKGIAGSAMNAFERMSSMIPPPPKPELSDRNSATSEGDSQPDNDEWED